MPEPNVINRLRVDKDIEVNSIQGTNIDISEYKRTLNGSESPNDPRTGLDTEIRSAIDEGRVILDINGCWQIGELQYSARSETPVFNVDGQNYRLPLYMDFTGAMIEYPGDSYAITDNGDPMLGGSRLNGGVTKLIGGFFFATGNPDGLFWGPDCGKAEIAPNEVHEFYTDGSTSVIRIEAVESWCENNHIHDISFYNCDTAVEFIDNNTPNESVSFQDNKLINLKMDRIQNGVAAIDIGGNFIDCFGHNLKGIAGSEEAALFRHNSNMGGTVFTATEMEAGGGPSTIYHVRIGPDAIYGPMELGGQHPAELTRFDLTNDPATWSWFWVTTKGGLHQTWRFAGGGQTFMVEKGGAGFQIKQIGNVNDTSPSSAVALWPSGDVQISGTLTENHTF